MKPLPQLLASLTVAAAAFAGGIYYGRSHPGHSPGPESAAGAAPAGSPASVSARPGDKPESGSIFPDDGQIRTDIQLARTSPVEFIHSLQGSSDLKSQARISAAIADMPLEAIREMAGKTKALGFGYAGGNQGWKLLGAMYERWAELDAEDLLATSMQSSSDTARWQGIPAAFRQLAIQDPEGAWKRAQDCGADTFNARASVLQLVGEKDPASALRMLVSTQTTGRDAWMSGTFMQGWLLKDRSAALQAVSSLPNGGFRTNLIGEMSDTFARTDPDAALEWSRTLTNPAERTRVLHGVIGAMTDRDPQQTLAMLDQPAFTAVRRDGLEKVVEAWARKDFDGALSYALASKSPADLQRMVSTLSRNANNAQRSRLLAAAAELPPSVSKSIYSDSFSRSFYGNNVDPQEILAQVSSPGVREDLIKSRLEYGYSDPEEALKLFSQLQPASRTTNQVQNLASRLAWSDPAAALKWAEQLDSADLRNTALKTTLQAWSGTDPHAAAKRAAEVTDPSLRSDICRGIAGTWASNDHTAALTWAQSLTGNDRSAALGALVQNSLEASPDRAQDLYTRFAASLDAESAGKAGNTAVARSVAATLTENDPAHAISWAGSLASGGARNEAYAGIAEKWAAYDPAATSEWVQTLPQGEGRDLAARKLVSSIARDDPDSAWAWATSIQDPAQRREAAAQVLQSWKSYGKAGHARTALESAGFSPDEARELSKKLD